MSKGMSTIMSHKEEPSRWPPERDDEFESAEALARKAALEREARQMSEKIDLDISMERLRRRKIKAVKILLLGQSESGKSTTLRNFQLNLAPQAFRADAEAWRTVIHLNLLISVNYLLDVLKESLPAATNPRDGSSYIFMTPSRRLIEKERMRLRSLDGLSVEISDPDKQLAPKYSSHLRRLMLSLLPLKSIETSLKQRLEAEPCLSSPSNETTRSDEAIRGDDGLMSRSGPDEPLEPLARPASTQSFSPGLHTKYMPGFRRHSISSSGTSSSPYVMTSSTNTRRCNTGIPSAALSSEPQRRDKQQNCRSSRLYGLVDSFAVKVRGSTGWRRRARIPDTLTSSGRSSSTSAEERDCPENHSRRPSLDAMTGQEERDLLSARQIIEVFGDDIQKLWRNEEVQKILEDKKIQLENRSGFFLNDVPRITAFDYVPTTADILRARLQTTGIEEHHLVLETGPNAGKEWIIYDVGGFRSQRAAWAPFFDSVNVIIFLAPISSFDEWLAEDPSVNRLEDTFHLWREICANHLLASVDFILFLNKYDALRAKLKSGARFSDYVVNYNDQNGTKNDADSIARWMLLTFNAAHKRLSPKPRKLRAYLTSVVDSRATAKVVNHLSEQVLISNLTQSDIL